MADAQIIAKYKKVLTF